MTDLDVIVVRDGKNLKGEAVQLGARNHRQGVLEKALKSSVKAIEIRNGVAREVGAA